MSIPRLLGGSHKVYYDLASEAPECFFHDTLLVKQVTKATPILRRGSSIYVQSGKALTVLISGDYPAVKQIYYPGEQSTSVTPFLNQVSYALLNTGDGFSTRKYFGKVASRKKESEKSVV